MKMFLLILFLRKYEESSEQGASEAFLFLDHFIISLRMPVLVTLAHTLLLMLLTEILRHLAVMLEGKYFDEVLQK